MTVKELKSKIENLPDDMDVMIDQYEDEGRYSLAEQANIGKVRFQSEEIPQEEWPEIDCLVISNIF